MKRLFPISLLAAATVFWLLGCDNSQQSSFTGPPSASAGQSGWLTDFEQAKALAAEKNRPVLLNFTGSDWCPPCIQLKKDILSTDEFGKYAEEELVLLELDFPRRTPQPENLKRQNEELAGAFDVEGFPTLILLSPQGKELARNVGSMPGGPERFIQWAESARN
jgi:thioredoxin-related protein